MMSSSFFKKLILRYSWFSYQEVIDNEKEISTTFYIQVSAEYSLPGSQAVMVFVDSTLGCFNP